MTTGDKESSLPLSTLLHLLTIKLSSANYLLWRNQIEPLLSFQKLLGHVDGTNPAPSPTLPATITTTSSSILSTPNPEYAKWKEDDQRVLLLLQSSLTEEAMAEVLGLKSALDVWTALEDAYSHDSVERMQTLRDSLRHLKKGTSTVAEYGRKFKAICDQLAAIGHPVDDYDKSHWFLCGLGNSFEHFSISQRAIKPRPSFRDLLSQAEGHEFFVQSLNQTSVPQASFLSTQTRGGYNGGRGSRGGSTGGRNRGGSHGGRGRGRRPPHCQLCRKDGHYANQCPDLQTFAVRSHTADANLASAFHSSYTDTSPDWYVDSGATAHMTPSTSSVPGAKPYNGSDHVSFGNESPNQGHSCSGKG